MIYIFRILRFLCKASPALQSLPKSKTIAMIRVRRQTEKDVQSIMKGAPCLFPLRSRMTFDAKLDARSALAGSTISFCCCLTKYTSMLSGMPNVTMI